MQKILSLLITSFVLLSAKAQEANTTKRNKKEEKKMRINAILKQEEEGVLKYKKHTAIGIKLTSDGYGGFVEVAKAQSVRKALLFQLDISERKHEKEEKTQVITLYGQTSPFIYGKINFLYPVKLGLQQQYLLGNKGNKNGVSITGNAGGGLIAGLLRPYEVQVDKNGESTYIGYDPNDTSFLFFNGQLGGPGLGTGWDKLKLRPGAYLKTAVRFDFGKYNEMVNAVEIALTGEYYLNKIQLMAFQKEKPFFFSGQVAIIFGKRK